MTEPQRGRTPAPGGAESFATTRWSIVLAADRGASPHSTDALAQLCQSYWYPLYAYVRRRGHDAHEAADLTQEFLTRLLEKHDLRLADPQRGRFRSFLLGSLNHFLANEWRAARAAKRGGGLKNLSLDFEAGESRYHLEPADETSPEKIFERRWAMTLLQRATDRLAAEWADAGKASQFEQLKPILGGDESKTYAEIAAALDMTEGAVKVAVHRLRKRCRELLREEIAQTVTQESDVAEELRHLFNAIGKSG